MPEDKRKPDRSRDKATQDSTLSGTTPGLHEQVSNEDSSDMTPFVGTFGSVYSGSVPGMQLNPYYFTLFPEMHLEGTELNPLYDPAVRMDTFAHRDLHKNDVEAMQSLLQTRLGQIEMLKKFSLNNNAPSIRSELYQIQAEYERMASEIRQTILAYGDQPEHDLDFTGRLQSWVHSWQAMTNDGVEAVDVILNTESDILGSEEQTIATMHHADCRDLAMRQLGEERQLYQKLRDLAQKEHR